MSTRSSRGMRRSVVRPLLAIALTLMLFLSAQRPAYSHNDSSNHALPSCGNEGEVVCWGALHDGNSSASGDWEYHAMTENACDRGLTINGGLATSNCVNGRRHSYSSSSDTWVLWALDQQLYNIGRFEPVNWLTRLNAHNAYNSWNDGYGLPNQWYSISDQLNSGARGIDLDLHPYGEFVRLTHGKVQGTGDRLYSQAIKEIGKWLDGHPEQVIFISLEDYTGSSDDDQVTKPIDTFLGNRVLKSSDKAKFSGRWPTYAELMDPTQWDCNCSKQVIIIDSIRAAFRPSVIDAPNFYAPARLFKAGLCEDNDGNSFRTKDDRFGKVYESRTSIETGGVPATPPDYWAGLIQETQDTLPNNWSSSYTTLIRGVDQIQECGASFIGLDFFAAADKTIAGEIQRIGKPDKRREKAVWSWAENDTGQNGMAAQWQASDKRWHSADPNTQAHFACAKPRKGNPTDWEDKVGENWG